MDYYIDGTVCGTGEEMGKLANNCMVGGFLLGFLVGWVVQRLVRRWIREA